MGARRVQLAIPPRSDQVVLARLLVESISSTSSRLTERRVDDLRLATSEVCTNAVEALEEIGSTAPVIIVIEVDDDSVVVTLTDRGGGFDLAEVDPLPHPSDPSRLHHEHGLGIGLTRSLVDEATFRRTADGTEVRLVMRP
jgi:serine/threonine-protein kinase RsbW